MGWLCLSFSHQGDNIPNLLDGFQVEQGFPELLGPLFPENAP